MFTKKPLPYNLDALEPYISKQTMDYHYNKHHQAYADGLNKTINNFIENHLNNNKNTEQVKQWKTIINDLENLTINYLLLPKDYTIGIRQFGGGLINHNFFFSILAKDKTLENKKIKIAIEKEFGSIEQWQEKMELSALQVFGSGWTWLVIDTKGKIKIKNTFNQDNPWFIKNHPLIGIDVWEHAYYLDYKNDRKSYVKNFFNVINWDVIEQLYEDYLKQNK